MMLLMLAIGVGAWALGRTQTDGGPGPGGGRGGGGASGVPPQGHAQSNNQSNAHSNAQSNPQPNSQSNTQSNTQSNGYAGGPAPGQGSTYNTGAGGGPTAGEQPKPSWQRPNPPPGGAGPSKANGAANGAAKGAWERAREETKKKEEERKAREAEKKRKDDMEKRIREAREKEAREREAREREARERDAQKEALKEAQRQAQDQAQKEAREKETRENLLREAREKLAREKLARETRERLAQEREKLVREREKDAREREAREKASREKQQEAKASSTYAFSAVGEKTNPWPRGQPTPPSASARSPAASPTKRPPAPSAKTHLGKDEDAYSYRPYDTPKKPVHNKAPSSVYSESSYAASHSTSRTTPPPSHRGAYSTKDPDKIVIKAVYSFNNAFIKTPSSQLVSGVGSVTDGLILRITTEGLFIDDDVRGVPQREWDVKAWTMKLVEVWCPSFCQGPAGNSASARVAFNSAKHNPVRRLWGLDKEKAATSEETDALLVDMLHLCRDTCRSSASSASSFNGRSSASDSAYGSSAGSPLNPKTNGVSYQTGEQKSAGLHVLRASIRDQDGKKYLFIIADEESWKIAVGLQRLRKGSQVRALGVSGMSSSDARGTLENLGWV
jgi:hypothetical protein